MSWFSRNELEEVGFRRLGKNVLVDKKAVILNPHKISLGDYSRIDAYGILSPSEGFVEIHRNCHVGSGTSLSGKYGLTLKCGSSLSAGTKVFSVTDDYTRGYLRNPTIEKGLRSEMGDEVNLGALSVVGSNSVLLPGSKVGIGSSVGALSKLSEKLPNFTVFSSGEKIKMGNSAITRMRELSGRLHLCKGCILDLRTAFAEEIGKS